MKKKDIILMLSVIMIALAMLAAMKATEGANGSLIRITVDGEEYGTYSLDKDQEIKVDIGNFHNKICICDGEAYMEEANCPDGYCMNQGKIKGRRQTIVCLPHKLVVEVTGTRENDQSDESEGIPDTVAE